MAKQKRLIAAGGRSGDYLDHSSPTPATLSSLIPVTIGVPCTAEATAMITSHDLALRHLSKGLHVVDIPIPIYRADNIGSPRKLDNTDVLTGKGPLYDSLDHFRAIYRDVESLVQNWKDGYKGRDDLIASMEMQDLEKVSIQQFKPTGWFIDPPIAPHVKNGSLDPRFLRALDAVMKKYASTGIEGGPRASFDACLQLMLSDFDPPDSMTGLPTMASGERTHVARTLTLLAYPDPRGLTPSRFLDRADSLGGALGFQSGWIYSALVSTRLGPIGPKRTTPLWTATSGGFTSSHESKSVYNRVRKVFPAAYPMNFLLSALYVQFSHARQKIMGLWHTPEMMTNYVKKIASQGKFPYAVDFSAMDMSITPRHVGAIMASAVKHGFASWPATLLTELMTRMGVFYPHFGNSPGMTTFFTGSFGWFSGWKLTSEIDTIYGAATLLACMEEMFPGTTAKWLDGSFVFAENGDDIQFNWHTLIDDDNFRKLAMDISGADLKIFHDAIFLKNFLPVHPDVPKLTRPFSRLIQQTFFNEDRYEGGKGGARPDALLRLALLARTHNLKYHPEFKTKWGEAWAVIKQLGYISRSTPSYVSSMEKGQFCLDSGDEAAIQTYAEKNPEYLQKLAERSKYEPSAALFMTMLEQATGTKIPVASYFDIRKVLLKSLITPPKSDSVLSLRKECTWMR